MALFISLALITTIFLNFPSFHITQDSYFQEVIIIFDDISVRV